MYNFLLAAYVTLFWIPATQFCLICELFSLFFLSMQQTFKNSFKNYFIAFQMLLKNFSLLILRVA